MEFEELYKRLVVKRHRSHKVKKNELRKCSTKSVPQVSTKRQRIHISKPPVHIEASIAHTTQYISSHNVNRHMRNLKMQRNYKALCKYLPFKTKSLGYLATAPLKDYEKALFEYRRYRQIRSERLAERIRSPNGLHSCMKGIKLESIAARLYEKSRNSSNNDNTNALMKNQILDDIVFYSPPSFQSHIHYSTSLATNAVPSPP